MGVGEEGGGKGHSGPTRMSPPPPLPPPPPALQRLTVLKAAAAPLSERNQSPQGVKVSMFGSVSEKSPRSRSLVGVTHHHTSTSARNFVQRSSQVSVVIEIHASRVNIWIGVVCIAKT